MVPPLISNLCFPRHGCPHNINFEWRKMPKRTHRISQKMNATNWSTFSTELIKMQQWPRSSIMHLSSWSIDKVTTITQLYSILLQAMAVPLNSILYTDYSIFDFKAHSTIRCTPFWCTTKCTTKENFLPQAVACDRTGCLGCHACSRPALCLPRKLYGHETQILP